MANFSYNSSDNISKYLDKAAAGAGNIFANIVEAKRKDNEIAEKTYLNIEALKKDVNIWGQKKVTEDVNNLLKEAGSKLFKGGKIDHAYLGELTSKVSQIKDNKNFFNTAPELMKMYQETGIKNADNMDSYAAFQKDLANELMSGSTSNAQDLQKKFDKILDNHTNYNTVGMKAFLASNPIETTKLTRPYIDAQGNESKRLEELSAPKNWIFDGQTGIAKAPETVAMVNPNTGLTEQVPYNKYAVASIKASQPDFFDKYRAKGNFGINITDEQIAENIVRSIKVDKASVEQKDIYQMQSEKAKAKSDILEAENKPKEIELGNKLKESQIEENRNQALRALRDTGSGSKGVPALNITPRQIPLIDKNGRRVVGKTQTVYDMTLPKPIVMDFPNVKTNKGAGSSLGAMKIVSVTKSVDGNYVVNAYPVEKGATNILDPSLAPTASNVLQKIKLDQAGYDSFMNRVIGESKENQQSIAAGMQSLKSNTVNANSFYGTAQ